MIVQANWYGNILSQQHNVIELWQIDLPNS